MKGPELRACPDGQRRLARPQHMYGVKWDRGARKDVSSRVTVVMQETLVCMQRNVSEKLPEQGWAYPAVCIMVCRSSRRWILVKLITCDRFEVSEHAETDPPNRRKLWWVKSSHVLSHGPSRAAELTIPGRVDVQRVGQTRQNMHVSVLGFLSGLT